MYILHSECGYLLAIDSASVVVLVLTLQAKLFVQEEIKIFFIGNYNAPTAISIYFLGYHTTTTNY